MELSLEERLRNILDYAYANAPAVKTILDNARISPGDIRTLADLNRIPVTTKDQLVKFQQADPPFGGFLAKPRKQLQRIYLEPGPFYVPWAGDKTVISSIQRIAELAGFQAGDTVINTVSYHLITIGSLLDEALIKAGITVIPGGVGNLDMQVKMMLDLDVTCSAGAPTYLLALIQKAVEMGHDFRSEFALRKAFVSGEPLSPNLRKILVEQYGLSILNVYTTAEIGGIAYNTDGSPPMRLFDSPIIQVVNPDTGQPVASGEAGEIVVTTFNETFPLIRFGTGDLALNLDPNPGFSAQEERSVILVGRVGDAVKVRTMFVHPNQLRHALSQVPGVARFQAIVDRPEFRDEFNLNIVLSETNPDRDLLVNAISEAVRSICRIKVDRIDFVTPESLAENAKLLVDKRTWQ